MTRLKTILAILCLTLSLEPDQGIAATHSIAENVGPLIVSPTRTKDSRGETVYETQGPTQKNEPVVPGVFVYGSPIKLPDPKYPKSLKKAHGQMNVKVEGVITQSGDFIDAIISDPVDPDVAKSALDTVAQYKFRPSTLDGKPVAILAQVVIQFRIR